MKRALKEIWNDLKGRKTYIIALMGLIYGIQINDVEIITGVLLAAGIRDGLSSEIAKTLTKPKKKK